MNKMFATFLLITCVFAVRAASAQNLLVNGGFEVPVQGPPFFATFNIPAGSTYITGWNVVQGNVDLTATASYGPGPNTLDPTSVQDIDLVGDTNGSGGVFGGLSQAFATVTGQQYQLTFHFSHNNGTMSPDYAAQVTVADANAPANTVLSEEVSQAFIDLGIPVWESFSQTFIANSDLTLLTFINTRGAFNAGIYLDNVSVTAPPVRALNLSTRLRVETGDKVVIGGFIITGSAPKAVVLRGLGPSLSKFGMTDLLFDPVLELRDHSGNLILRNDNWKDTQRNQIEGTPFQPSDDRESVIVTTLTPAAYTAILTGKNETTGVGAIEIYDNNPAVDSQLANLSTRGFVQTQDKVMIGGFSLGASNGSSRIALRGLGPSLARFGVSSVLADPTLELRDANGALLIANDDWQSDPVMAAQLTANGLALPDAKESGIFASLPPGQFTAILAGKNGGIGIGLVEIYNLK